jgi:hypothetical protein
MGWYHSADFLQEMDEAAAAAAASAPPPPPPASSSSGNTACPLPPAGTPPPPPPDVDFIYHLCQKSKWAVAVTKKEPYFPPTFVQDGKFTRATVHKEDIVSTANTFYKDSKGDWICLEINVKLLYGLGIPILAQEAPESTPKMSVKCLQVFGGISTTLPDLVPKIYTMKRKSDGSFVSIKEPVLTDCGCPNQAPADSAKKGHTKEQAKEQPETAKSRRFWQRK